MQTMRDTAEPAQVPLRGGQLSPLSAAAYRMLGEAGLIPENTELYGFVCTNEKMGMG